LDQVCHPVETTTAFQLKGGLYTLTVLQLLIEDMNMIESQLNIKIQQAPKFFKNAPIIIDVQKLKNGLPIDFKHLKEILLKHFLIPMGIKGADEEQQTNALLAGIPALPDSTKERTIESEAEFATHDVRPELSKIVTSHSKIIKEPVRSGQQIYAKGGDLIVLAPVSHGSELLADGNIHVYGPLRGRALAGVTGDSNTHIFCQNLEAELISIAGQYKISEDIEQSLWGLGVNIYLAGERLHISPL
jgi:septum site-determining protein MinC